MNKILHTALRVGSLLLAGAVGAAELTTQEVARIESGLGITLTPGQKTELAQIVKPNAPLPQWRSEAETRIEQHRKADLNVQVVDVNGNPVEGAQIRVTLRRNAFRFSGVMNLKDFTDEDENLQITTNRYRELFLALFNSGGLNNGLKPKQRVGNEPLLPAFFSWAQTNQVPVRGHLLVWPGVDDESNHLTPEVLSAVQAVEAALTN
ncbi:MAG: hypothetical protein JEZ10_05235, partial [Verrucomicrobia bacterium]|nr:hypothetical protein [Verrucomicrobiota bacterium]